jgi:hypothetical protein
VLHAQLLVQLQQVGREGARDDLALLGHGRFLGVEFLRHHTAARGRDPGPGLDGGDTFGEFGDPLLRGLAALHDLKDDILQVSLALGERGDLALQVLQVLGRGGRAGVEALLVANGALPDLVDVLLGLDLLAGGVALLGRRGDEQVAQLGEVLGEGLDLGVLGK